MPCSLLVALFLACTGKGQPCEEPPTWKLDADGDGYAGAEAVQSCTEPGGWSATVGDCDDTNASAHPGAAEVWYDGVDQDCLGGDDDDADGDGFAAQTAGGTDCDDQDMGVHPDAQELCGNGRDDNCDGDLGDCQLEGELGFEDAEVLFEGNAEYEGLGHGIAMGADLAGEGQAALALSVPASKSDPPSAEVRIYTVSSLGDEQVGTVHCDGSCNAFGLDLSTVVDLDGDGLRDLAVASDSRTNWYDHDSWLQGRLAWFAAPVVGSQVEDAADLSVLPADLDTRGLGDDVAPLGEADAPGAVAIAAMYSTVEGAEYAGRVFVIDPSEAGEIRLDAASPSVSGTAESAHLGDDVESADLDGDGVLDLLASHWLISGEPDDRGPAVISVWTGPVLTPATPLDAAITIVDSTQAWLGGDLHVTRDLDGDGLSDLVMKAWLGDEGTERVYMLSASELTSRTLVDQVYLARFDGEAASGTWGDSLATGDIDGDTSVDILIGEPYGDHGDTSTVGVVRLFYGPHEGVVSLGQAAATWFGDERYDYLGRPVISGTDLNADGRDDVAIGSVLWPGGEGRGRVLVSLGGCP